MYHWAVYFAGPKTRWQGRVHESEIVASGQSPWRWLARADLMTTFRRLDATRCGYVLMEAELCIEHYDPPIPESPVPA